MTPKEKAQELFERFRSEIISFLSDNMKDENAKRCALIAIDEMLSLANLMDGGFSFEKEILFLQEVKQEIENL